MKSTHLCDIFTQSSWTWRSYLVATKVPYLHHRPVYWRPVRYAHWSNTGVYIAMFAMSIYHCRCLVRHHKFLHRSQAFHNLRTSVWNHPHTRPLLLKKVKHHSPPTHWGIGKRKLSVVCNATDSVSGACVFHSDTFIQIFGHICTHILQQSVPGAGNDQNLADSYNSMIHHNGTKVLPPGANYGTVIHNMRDIRGDLAKNFRLI